MIARIRATDIVSYERASNLLQKYGSPLYVYSQEIINNKINIVKQAAKQFTINYAIKANTNMQIVRLIKKGGVTHIDAVSPGQINKALLCGFQPQNIEYTQNFISQEQIDFALNKNIKLNIGALATLQHFSPKLKNKNISIRINPKMGGGTTHHVITGGPESKFGIYQYDIPTVIKVAEENNIKITDLHQHIGSNLKKKDQQAFIQTTRYIFSLLPLFKDVTKINIGGGLGVAYSEQEQISNPFTLLSQIRNIAKEAQLKYNRKIDLAIQPGRFFVADSSLILCKITATKSTPLKTFFGTDTGFNHLIRPALYGSKHGIVNLSGSSEEKKSVTVCGNICQSTDILGQNIDLGGKIGDILAIQTTGAYGFSMSSNYNQRPRPAEVLLTMDGKDRLIRRRQTLEDLIDKMI